MILVVLVVAALLVLGGAAPATARPATPDPPDADPGDWIAAGPRDPAPVLDLVVDPTDPETVHLLTLAGLRTSRDGGTTWGSPTLTGACALAVSPTPPAHLYVVTAEPGADPRLWRSDDQGRRWREMAGLARDAAAPQRSEAQDSPDDPEARSDRPVDSPSRATGAGESTETPETARRTGPEARAAGPLPGGAGKADTPARCELAVDAQDPDVLVFAVVDARAAPRSRIGSGREVPSAPGAANTAVRLAWSWDGGSSLEPLPPPPFAPLDLLFTRDGTLLAAAGSGAWRSVDRGRSWRPSRLGLESRPGLESKPRDPSVEPAGESFRPVFRLAAGATRPQVLYAGAAADAGAAGCLLASRDDGETWQPAATGLPAGGVTALLVGRRGRTGGPDDLAVALAGGGLWRRTDGRWSPLAPLANDAEPVALGRLGDGPRDLLVATADGTLWRQTPPPPPCLDDATTLCLAGRFRVTLDAWSAGGTTGPARAVPLTSTSGWFWTTSPESPAAVLRVVDLRPADAAEGRAANEAGPWWVFWSSVSEDGFELHVTDTASGASRSYHQAPGAPAAGLDTTGFPASESPPGGGPRGDDGLWLASLPEGGCGDDSPDLCLGGETASDGEDRPSANRFRVAVDWEDGGERGVGVGDRLSPEAGWFRFSTTGDPELFVRVVDGRAVDGSWWVLFGGLTDAAYEIRVSDEASGEVVAYEVSAGEPTAHADHRAFSED